MDRDRQIDTYKCKHKTTVLKPRGWQHRVTTMDKDRQRQTKTDKDRQRQTKTDRDRQRDTYKNTYLTITRVKKPV